MRIEMKHFAEDKVLAGALPGQKVFAKLISSTIPPTAPEVYFLDFSGVDLATTSFLRESVLAYRSHARSHWGYVYPVVANLAPRVREELEHFLVDRGDALIVCDLDAKDRVSKVYVIGRLDGKQDVTLRAVVKAGEVDAPTLAERHKTGGVVSPTAWNNRLAALVTKGLLMEVSTGRSKRYRPVLERLSYGT